MRTALLRARGEPALRQYRPPPAQCHRKAWAARFRTAAQFVQSEGADRPMTGGCPARNTLGVPGSSTSFASKAHSVTREPTRDLIPQMRLGRPRAATELMSPRLPKSASPTQIVEPLHRKSSRTSGTVTCCTYPPRRELFWNPARGEEGFTLPWPRG